jgi:serine/threonine protein kinase
VPTNEVFQAVQFGNYTLVSQLGRGGMAEVFKAKVGGAQGFQKTVCVKRILRQHLEDQHFVDMFVNEAKISARLSHPNIVQVYDLGEIDGEFYMAMEFVHGRDLLRVMRSHGIDGAPPPPVCAYIAREMCKALGCAHDHVGENGQRQPIIHRDVSPQNVMISYDGVVKLVDFGIAKALEGATMEETRTGALKGKFAYMAPEQLDGQKASAVTDIFSVGVTLFEMLTGRRLFKGNTDYDTLVRVKTQPVPPPSELNPQVPPELDKICAQALQRDPMQRYQRASHMARDLEQFCGKIGFTSEDMKEFMLHLFPNREEVPDGVVAMPTPGSASGATGSGAVARPTPSNTNSGKRPVTYTGTGTPSTTAETPSGKKKGSAGIIVAVVAVLLLAGGGGAFVMLRDKGGEKGKDKPAVSDNVGDPPVATHPKKSPGVEEPVADGSIKIGSTPPGAEVLDGPKLLGLTPLSVKLGDDKPALMVRLSKSGFEDLTYTITASDAPMVTLKLNPKKHHGGGSSGSSPKSHDSEPSGPPKVKSFDDIDSSPPGGGAKVKAID